MEPQQTKAFPLQEGSFLCRYLKFESSGIYTSSAKERFPFAHITFKADFAVLTFITVLFEVVGI
jgi:hypothetical protein